MWVKNGFPLVFPKDKFVEITSKTTCCYCGISKDEIEKLAKNKNLFKKNMRGWSLELDRFNSNFEYSADNCDMACYWCNNAKTDEFSKEEFDEIGKAIKQVWKTRMSKEQ